MMLCTSPKLYPIVIRILCLILTLVLVYSYFSIIVRKENRILKGNCDFLDCYTAAKIIADGRGSSLYEISTQRAYQAGILRSLGTQIHFAGGVLLYSHPPFAALPYSMLARFSYATAYLIWSIISLSLLLSSLYLLQRTFGCLVQGSLAFFVLAVAAFLPFFVVIAQGQNTFLALFFLILALNLVKESKDFPAGIALSIMLVKFQILPVFLLIALIKRRWRVLLGFVAGAVLLISLSLPVFGIGGWSSYFRLLRAMPSFVNQYGFNVQGGYCIRGQIYALLFANYPRAAVFLTELIMFAFAILIVWVWKGHFPADDAVLDLKLAVTVIVAVLIAPLINLHDLSFLILPLCIIYGYATGTAIPRASRDLLLTVAMMVFFFLPLVQLVVGRYYPVQLMVWGLITLMLILLSHIKALLPELGHAGG
jgi:hypothetical protein